MAVHHSTENLIAAIQDSDQFCDICHEVLSRNDLVAATPCKHTFHNRCIVGHLQSSRICPVCQLDCSVNQLTYTNNSLAAEIQDATANSETLSQTVDQATNSNSQQTTSKFRGRGATPRRGMQTRSMNRNQRVPPADNSQRPNPRNMDRGEVLNLVETAMQSSQNQILQNLSSILSETIEKSISAQLAVLQLGRSEQNSQHPSSRTSPRSVSDLPPMSSANRNGVAENIPNLARPSSSIRAEKVSSIIQSWHIKFDGGRDGMQAQDFLYRVRSLTEQNLLGDYQILCDHLHLLFVGRANEWYWRVHRANPRFTWQSFCEEFRKKFEDTDDEMDVWEMINSRRQGDQESFEDFQFAIEKLIGRLQKDVSERSLVRILIHNSKSTLRYELMHLGITTLAKLREEIRTHEQFCKLVKTTKSKFDPRSRISELECETAQQISEEVSAIQRKQLICWNCDKPGHRFDDCLEIRSIFCYGCGAKNTFKPKCPSCNPSENRVRDAQNKSILPHPKH